jgi:hypothetical protein
MGKVVPLSTELWHQIERFLQWLTPAVSRAR